MNNEKLDNQLNLALSADQREREKTLDLDVGYNPAENTWELIVKYSGSLDRIREELNAVIVELMGEYAIVTILESYISRLSDYEEIEFIEKPKRLFTSVSYGRTISCINPLQLGSRPLFGNGILIAVIDSGIDYAHPDFRNQDGTTRILDLWDQSIPAVEGSSITTGDGRELPLGPPEGYRIGTLYTEEMINEALKQRSRPEQLEVVPSVDLSGHGTHVTGIAAGNGRASSGVNRGVAPQSRLLIVKLGNSIGESFPRTTQLMEAMDYVIKKATELKMPIAVNVSFGNNYGSHDGNSLLEGYFNSAANLWKSSIAVGTGNEGSASRHTEGIVGQTNVDGAGRTLVELAVSNFEPALNLQLWKNYYDEFDVELVSPGGASSGPINRVLGTQRFRLEDTEILLYYGEPIPYNRAQEIYFEFIPSDSYITSGIWTIRLIPRKIVNGNYNMWLPTGAAISPLTRFLLPSELTTLTLPSTANRVISVGAYNGRTDSYADFSGRGYTRGNHFVKPDIVAPGVDITSAAPGGGYNSQSGTSMATPFVTGSAALLMEWGIVNGNDPYLYGEKLKAYLISGARQLSAAREYPNPMFGYGALCVENSLPR